MYRYCFYTLLLSIYALFFLAHAEVAPRSDLPLPQSLNSHAVYHIKVKQLHEFSCGYNALFNGCNVENWCGYSNRMNEFSRFRQACYDFTAAHDIRRKSSLNNKQIEQLARQLGMHRVVHLHIDAYNKVAPLLTKEVRITYAQGTTEAVIKRMLEAEMARQQTAHIQEVKTNLERATVFPYVVHFICIVQVDGTSHGILVTLIKNQTGTGLYIFDNMNKKISESSQIRRCIEYLVNTFTICPRQSYKGPLFPTSWPSLKNQSHSLASYVGYAS